MGRKGTETRQRVLAAATELFAAQGYHATSITDIGERAGLQRGALYYHIESKEQLLYDVLLGHAADVLADVAEIAAAEAPAVDRLRQLLSYQTDLLLDRRAAMLIFQRDRPALDPALEAEVNAVGLEIEAAWLRVLRDGVREGSLRKVDPVVVKGMIEMVNSVHRWYRPDGRLSRAQINNRLTDFVLRGLGVA